MEEVVHQLQWKKSLTSYNGRSSSPAAMEEAVDVSPAAMEEVVASRRAAAMEEVVDQLKWKT